MWSLVLFSIGGMNLAARTEDVGSVTHWGTTVPVPSRTPFVHSLIKRDTEVLPVYDLASQLNQKQGHKDKLCLIARHTDGPIAICIDGTIPTLHAVDVAEIRPGRRPDIATLGHFKYSGQDIPIVALQRLGDSKLET
jgi:chemotaxis signal transduction protein